MEEEIKENKEQEEIKTEKAVPEPIPETMKMELPNSTAVLVLGILSLVFCWCYGFIGLVLGIIAVALSVSARKLYAANPSAYKENSYKNLNAGRTCGIIGICLSSIIFIIIILVFVGIFSAAMIGALNGLN